jgi:hypothetical protein
MESLKNIGEICKRHYEKLVLICSLVILAGAVFYLYTETQKEQDTIKEFFIGAGRKSAKGVKPADLTNYLAVMQVAKNPPQLNFGLPHNLLNPVKWKRGVNGELIKEQKGTESLDRLEITSIRPLNFTIAFDRVAGSGYWINITNEVATGGARRMAQFATLNATNVKVFILRDLKGAPEEPTELVLELKDTGERVSIAKEKPFVRAEAYEADLRYALENKTFTKQRVGATLRFGGEEYKIVAINQNEIVLLAGNDKKYTVRYNANTTAAK